MGRVPDWSGLGMSVTSMLKSESSTAWRTFHGVGLHGDPTDGSTCCPLARGGGHGGGRSLMIGLLMVLGSSGVVAPDC